MSERGQVCVVCGEDLTIVPPLVHVTHDIDWQDGRMGDPVDMSMVMGEKTHVTSRRKHADLLKQNRENYWKRTGIDTGEQFIHDEHVGCNRIRSSFDSSVPSGRDGETVEQFEKRVGR